MNQPYMYTYETKITRGSFSPSFPTISEYMPLHMRREFFRRIIGWSSLKHVKQTGLLSAAGIHKAWKVLYNGKTKSK